MAHDPDLVASLWAEYKPQIDFARKAERETGDQAFLALHEERIGEFPAIQLTPAKYLLLDQLGCLENPVTQTTLRRFLWVVSPKFRPSWWAGKWFMVRHWRIKGDLIKDVEAYLARTFSAMPGGTGKKESIGWVASMVDLLASQYGWPESEILNCPLKRVFQYVASISSRITGKPVTFSSRADALQSEFMHKANAGI